MTLHDWGWMMIVNPARTKVELVFDANDTVLRMREKAFEIFNPASLDRAFWVELMFTIIKNCTGRVNIELLEKAFARASSETDLNGVYNNYVTLIQTAAVQNVLLRQLIDEVTVSEVTSITGLIQQLKLKYDSIEGEFEQRLFNSLYQKANKLTDRELVAMQEFYSNYSASQLREPNREDIYDGLVKFLDNIGH